jgi:hypothetical protein
MGRKKRSSGNGKSAPETTTQAPQEQPATDGRVSRFSRPFMFAMGPDDRARKMDEAREKQQIIDATNDEISRLKTEAAALSKRVKAIEAEKDGLIRSSGAGSEERSVECERRPHPTRPVWQLVRLDTGEVFDEVVMSDADRQERIDAVAPAGEPLPKERWLPAQGGSTVIDVEAVEAPVDDRELDDPRGAEAEPA